VPSITYIETAQLTLIYLFRVSGRTRCKNKKCNVIHHSMYPQIIHQKIWSYNSR